MGRPSRDQFAHQHHLSSYAEQLLQAGSSQSPQCQIQVPRFKERQEICRSPRYLQSTTPDYYEVDCRHAWQDGCQAQVAREQFAADQQYAADKHATNSLPTPEECHQFSYLRPNQGYFPHSTPQIAPHQGSTGHTNSAFASNLFTGANNHAHGYQRMAEGAIGNFITENNTIFSYEKESGQENMAENANRNEAAEEIKLEPPAEWPLTEVIAELENMERVLVEWQQNRERLDQRIVQFSEDLDMIDQGIEALEMNSGGESMETSEEDWGMKKD